MAKHSERDTPFFSLAFSILSESEGETGRRSDILSI